MTTISNQKNIRVSEKRAYHFFPALFVVAVIFFSPRPAQAQQTDTTGTTEELKLRQRQIQQPYHSERSTNNFLLPSSGTYGVPEPTEYYKPPFMGQESLDAAVEAYRKELKEGLGNSVILRFLKTIAPYINNQFEFGVYQIYDLPIVERDHPLRYPQLNSGKDKDQE